MRTIRRCVRLSAVLAGLFFGAQQVCMWWASSRHIYSGRYWFGSILDPKPGGTMRIEILCFAGCPNHAPVVERVREALTQEGKVAELVEVEVKDTSSAQRFGFLGSPSV